MFDLVVRPMLSFYYFLFQPKEIWFSTQNIYTQQEPLSPNIKFRNIDASNTNGSSIE